jgi:WD40 repeat protein
VTIIDAARLLPYFAFSPDNTKVITYREKKIHFWDVQSWKEIDVRALHLEGKKIFSFSPDGSLFLSSGEQKKEKRETRTIYEVKVWDARRFEAIRTYLIEVYGEEMIKCRFGQDGKRIFWASDETIKFFDIETGEELTYKDRSGGMSAFAFSPEERKIFVGNKEGHIFIFSLENVPEFPAVVTPLEKNGKLFFRCFYCTENNEIKKRSLGQEIECRHCGHINRLNPFVWVSHQFKR